MSNEVRKGYEKFLNCKVKIVFIDEEITAKKGILISVSDDALIIIVDETQKEVLIPKARIIKVEVMA